METDTGLRHTPYINGHAAEWRLSRMSAQLGDSGKMKRNGWFYFKSRYYDTGQWKSDYSSGLQ
jgi:hypothetical protein